MCVSAIMCFTADIQLCAANAIQSQYAIVHILLTVDCLYGFIQSADRLLYHT